MLLNGRCDVEVQDFGIEAIGVYIPDDKLVCADHRHRLGMSSDTLERRTGFTALARKHASEDTSDMACKAVLDLFDRSKLSPDQIDCLVVVTQNPDGYGIPQVSALVHGKLELPESIAAFDLSLGCSGYVYALSIVKSSCYQWSPKWHPDHRRSLQQDRRHR